MSVDAPAIRLPAPDLQVAFSFELARLKRLSLQEGLSEAVGKVDLAALDQELQQFAPASGLTALATASLRGELLFATPLILSQNPRLLSYYRLLLGYSQKEFYGTKTGAGAFRLMESDGRITHGAEGRIAALCYALNDSGAKLLDGIGSERVSKEHFDHLTLLSLGPQLRGGANVKRGVNGIVQVFQIIHDIVESSTTAASDEKRLVLKNAAGSLVSIEFSPDPDIVMRTEMESGAQRNVVAIEVKAGEDFSNIHNRLGEAEKSHQKARINGFVECWTVINVQGISEQYAKRESPSTDRLYKLAELMNVDSAGHKDFRDRIISMAGLSIGSQ